MTTEAQEATVLIPKGGGWYWVGEIGGERIQLSKADLEAGNYTVIDEADTPVNPDLDEVELLRAELAKAARKIEEQAAEIEAAKPTVNVERWLFESIEDVKAFYPEKHLKDLAAAEFASINKARTKQGYDRITYTDAEIDAAMEDILAGLLADRKAGAHTEGPLLRTLKMIAPDGSLRQVPYEGQFNNIAGSLEDGYRIYTKKGFKRTEPLLCPAGDCWEVAAMENGQMLFTGYCSQDHFNRTESGGASTVPGVTTSGSISGRR